MTRRDTLHGGDGGDGSDGAVQAPPKTAGRFAAGAVIGKRYRVVRFIAQGGMGAVYEVEDLELGERVALKTLLPDGADGERAVDRFKREILLARQVTHPNVCRILELGYEEELIFLTM